MTQVGEAISAKLGTVMDLESVKSGSRFQQLTRIGMLVSFAVAAAILLFSVTNPSVKATDTPETIARKS